VKYQRIPEVICGTGRSWSASQRVGLTQPRVEHAEWLPGRRSDPRADRELLEFLAAITTEYEDKLREVLREEAKAEARAAREREQLEFLAEISLPREQTLRALRRTEAEAQEQRELVEFVRTISTPTHEDGWNPALHPRTGTPPNPGWWAKTGGSGTAQEPHTREYGPPAATPYKATTVWQTAHKTTTPKTYDAKKSAYSGGIIVGG